MRTHDLIRKLRDALDNPKIGKKDRIALQAEIESLIRFQIQNKASIVF